MSDHGYRERMNWIAEVDELHAFFEAYFLGRIDSLDRFESVLAPGFTIVDPTGSVQTRAETLESVRSAHAHTNQLSIVTSDHSLLYEQDGFVLGRYIETHHLTERTNRRLSTVGFVAALDKPNGLAWVTVHETWLDRE